MGNKIPPLLCRTRGGSWYHLRLPPSLAGWLVSVRAVTGCPVSLTTRLAGPCESNWSVTRPPEGISLLDLPPCTIRRLSVRFDSYLSQGCLCNEIIRQQGGVSRFLSIPPWAGSCLFPVASHFDAFTEGWVGMEEQDHPFFRVDLAQVLVGQAGESGDIGFVFAG